jgi:hypothetical protein
LSTGVIVTDPAEPITYDKAILRQCHGTPGKPDRFPHSLFPDAPQFPVIGTAYSEAQVFWVAKHGIRHSGMFVNGLWDSDEELWRLTAYVKRMNALPPQVQQELARKPKHSQ